MNKYIYLIYIVTALCWCSSVFAQETEKELANAKISETVVLDDSTDLVPVNDSVIESDKQSAKSGIQVAEDEVSAAPITLAPLKSETPPVIDEVPQMKSAESSQEEEKVVEIYPEELTGWRGGIALSLGIGPVFDLRDPAGGYSARFGLDIHGQYLGMGFEVTWHMLWAMVNTKYADNSHVDYRNTNSAFMILLHGYIPTTDRFLVTLGAGIGLGKRYEIAFSDIKSNADGSSWLARFQMGGMWLFDQLTVSLELESNFGNYISTEGMWWSDTANEISLGLVCSFSYHFFKKK